VTLFPDEVTLEKYPLLADKYCKRKDELACSSREKITAKDGRPILVAANIGGLEDLKSTLTSEADGVGL
jgi:phosphoenolpyruvate-protein kinase (PTS system EI component)